MKRAAIISLLVSTAVALAAAVGAQSQSPYTLPEPKVTSAQVLRLAAKTTGTCSKRRVALGVLTPPGLSYSSLQLRVGSGALVNLTSVTGPLSASLALPTTRVGVTISARTKAGAVLRVARTYKRCAKPKPKPKAKPRPTPSRPSTPVVEEGRNPPPVIFEGGGED